MKFRNRAILISALFMFSCLLALGNGPYNKVHAQDQAEGEGEATQAQLPGGWINWIAPDAIVIDDTQYIIVEETRYPDGKEVLTEGEFVRFRVQKENILSEIFPGEPRPDEMYMKPIARTENNDSSEAEKEIAPTANESANERESESGEMRLEDGVWVN